jgi:hypothetical protein
MYQKLKPRIEGANDGTRRTAIWPNRLLRLLITGGLSDTYLAETMSAPSHLVASKVFPWARSLSSTPAAPEAEQHFFHQVEAISQLQHPSIVPIYDYGQVTLRDENYLE